MAERKLQLNVLQSFTFVHSCAIFFFWKCQKLQHCSPFHTFFALIYAKHSLDPQTCWNSYLDQPIWWFTYISMKICQYSLTLVSFQNLFLLWSTKVNFWRICRPLFSTHSKWIKTRPVEHRKDTKEPQKYQYSSFYVFWSHATYWNLSYSLEVVKGLTVLTESTQNKDRLVIESFTDFPCVSLRRAHPYVLIPSKSLPSEVRASKGWRV